MIRPRSQLQRAALLSLLAIGAVTPARSAGAPLSDRAREIASAVDTLRLRETIRLLSQDSTGATVSRYAERAETRLLYAPMVRDLLDSFLVSPDTVFLAPFSSARTDTPQVNVIGIGKAETGSSPGLVLLTGHLDTTGRRTAGGWQGLSDAAPGADDNASGVACVIEGARILTEPPACLACPQRLPFDLAFVAFGAEEAFGPSNSAPLEGSRVFARALTDSGVPILAVFNADMIAFNPDRKKIDIVTNAASEWIADLIVDTAPAVAPGLIVKKILSETTFNSDHASFWNVGDDAITAIENRFPDESDSLLYPGNPHYHTTHDTLGTLNLAMAADVTRVILASIQRLAESPPGPPDLLVDSPHILVTRPRKIFVGDEAIVEVRVFNRGGAFADGGNSAATVRLEHVNPGVKAGPSLIGEQEIALPIAPWFFERVEFRWPVKDQNWGVGQLVATVTAPGLGEATTSNNVAERAVTVFRNAISDLRTVPNPMRLSESPEDINFEFDLPLRPGVAQAVEAVVYDAAGREVAWHEREDAQDGINRRLFWKNFELREGDALPSGIYIVEVRLIDRSGGGVVSRSVGKFALFR